MARSEREARALLGSSRRVRGMGIFSTAAVALAISTLGPPAAAVESSSSEEPPAAEKAATRTSSAETTTREASSRPATKATSKPAATKPAGRPAVQPTRDASGRRVWTNADLQRLKASGAGRVNVITSHHQALQVDVRRPPEVDQNLAMRFREIIQESDEKLRRLETERLAARNPFLRGTVRDAAGKPRAPRSLSEIEADIAKWTQRKAMAEGSLSRMARATDTPIEDLAPERIVEEAPEADDDGPKVVKP